MHYFIIELFRNVNAYDSHSQKTDCWKWFIEYDDAVQLQSLHINKVYWLHGVNVSTTADVTKC